MKAKLNNSTLQELYKFSSDGQCLFIQKWSELFFYKTINTYQFKLRNSHTILKETKSVLDLMKSHSISPANLKDLIQECKKHLEKDLSFKKHYRDLLDTLIKNLKLKSTDKNDLLQLEYRLNNALRFITNTYKKNLISDLETAISQNEFEEIEHFTDLLASELVNQGWSPASLNRLLQIYFTSAKCLEKTFEERWENFIKEINKNEGYFHCYFKIDETDHHFIDNLKASDLKVVSGEELLKTFININTHVQKESFYLEERVEAHYEDMRSAVEKSRYQLAIKQSILSYFGTYLEDFSKVLVIFPDENKIVDFELRSENNLEVEPIDDDIHLVVSLLKDETLLEEDRQRLLNFFRQYDLSIKAFSIETKYSNLWSSIESLLVTGHHESLIDHIKKIIPSIMCSNYVQRLLYNFLEDCYRAGLRPLFNAELIDKGKQDCLINLFKLFTEDENKLEDFINSLDDYTLLKQRCIEISKSLSDSKTLRDLMTNHFNTLTWHIQRLYRVRNNLVHAATAEKDITLLIEHLHFYIRSTIHELVSKIQNKEFNSLGNLYLAIEDNYYALIEILMKNISDSPKKGPINRYESDLIFEGPIFIYE
ncbi:hypothetical protein LCD52_13000 [Rossellomorea vietnamensis]|uniref:hypothetical protein n=1 Tax=Rossellomorea vietnamensis TaxID=218284 RepID=UPI001CCA3C39|nr:hypothetical protein [Rossellomorea vietnamensis]MCA0149711.1 hypothetical protein [Rossellomorea vietnamensis]